MSHDGETPILHKNITPTDTNEKLDRRHHGHIRKRWMFAGATVVVLPPSMRRCWIHAYGDDVRATRDFATVAILLGGLAQTL